MSKVASKNMSRLVKKTLLRKKPREVREYDKHDSSSIIHKDLIDSFDRESFIEYETWLHRWGTPGRKKEIMLEQINKKNIIGPIKELASIRSIDLSTHTLIIQCLRHRWLDLEEYNKEKSNNDPDTFWRTMALGVRSSAKNRKNVNISSTWDGDKGRDELIKYLKTLYKKQDGKCAITGLPLELQTGTGKPNPNKCSVDRIDSNRGYNNRNVWLVAWWANQMKLDMTMETFNQRIKILYEAQNKQ